MSDTLLEKKVVFVTGKGGTGKSTLAMALAMLGARRNKKILVAEIDMTRPAAHAFFGRSPGFSPTYLAEGVDGVNITFLEALHLYLSQTISVNLVVSRILRNRIVRRFLFSTPFARELVFLNTVYHYYRQAGHYGYDTIVVDLPASGHAVPMLTVPKNVFNLFEKGPLLRRARQLYRFLTEQDAVTVCLVTIGEEMSVTETLETYGKLRSALPIEVGGLFANRLPEAALTGGEVTVVEEWLEKLDPGAPERVRFALDLSVSLARIAKRSEAQIRRLENTLGRTATRISELVGTVSVPIAMADALEQAL